MKACLNVYRDKVLKQSFVLNQNQISLGNLAGLDVSLPREGQQEECFLEINFSEGRFLLHGRRGFSQCRLNDQPIDTAPHRLRLGDRLQIGAYLLIFDIAKEECLSASPSANTQMTSFPSAAVSRADDQSKTLQHALKLVCQGKECWTRLLQKDKFFIGRMAENDLVVDDPLASRSHALIERQGNEYWLRDQESENGLYLNGLRIGQAKLKIGDVIRIGDHELHFILARATPESALTANPAAGDEEWRLNRTVTLNSEEQQKLLAQIKNREVLSNSENTPIKPSPAGEAMMASLAAGGSGEPLRLRLQIGAQVFEKELTLNRLSQEEAADKDTLELRLHIQGSVYSVRWPLRGLA